MEFLDEEIENCDDVIEDKSDVLIVKKKKKRNKKKKKKEKIATFSPLLVVVKELDPLTVFTSSDVIYSWYSAYQSAFKNENDFIDGINNKLKSSSAGCGSESSQAMGLDGAAMMPLVFLPAATDNKRFRRVCFFAWESENIDGEKDFPVSSNSCLVGYATVDEDIQNPGGVCHIRMILVDPTHQRRGIGKLMLLHIEERFRNHHLGLKFANCNNYQSFYESVGFKVIGEDMQYTYMAIRRE